MNHMLRPITPVMAAAHEKEFSEFRENNPHTNLRIGEQFDRVSGPVLEEPKFEFKQEDEPTFEPLNTQFDLSNNFDDDYDPNDPYNLRRY